MNPVVVRKSEPNEMAQIIELFKTVFVDTFFKSAPAFKDVTDGEQIYVALLDDNLIGFASIWEPDRFIHYLFVSPNARHKKVGSALIDRLAEIYGGPLFLKCLINNETGMAFYRSTGWKQIGNGNSDDGAYALLSYNPCERKL